MEINRHNYEAYLLDQLEGRLSVEDQQLLQNFLLLNPDCAGDLEEIEPWVLEVGEHSFQNKGRLMKELPNASSELSESNFDLFCIARMEGDLSSQQEDAHRAMVSAEDLKDRHWREWQETKLKPEEVLFKGKDKLKHEDRPKRSLIWISVISTAAAIALLLVLFRSGTDLPQTEQAQEVSGEAADIPVQRDVQYDVQDDVQDDVQEIAQEEIQAMLAARPEEPARREQELPADSEPLMTVIPQEVLKTGSLAGSVNLINASSLVGEVVPDRIETLHIPPGKVHLSSLTVGQIHDMDLQEVIGDYAQSKDISLFSIASAGIKGFNKLAGSDISLLASRNEEGEVSGIRLRGKRFSFSKPLGEEE